MVRPIAVLVEDDPEQAAVSLEVLRGQGFEVRAFEAAAPVLDYLARPQELVDLFVLDRRLPVQFGQPPADEVGDALLTQIRTEYPDARVIVFTGFASIEHVQETVRGSGQLPNHDGEAIDRVSVLQKHQSLEFQAQVKALHDLLQSLNDIEIVDGGVVVDALHRRMIRRVGHYYGAASVDVRPLSGGLTEAAVWLCHRQGPQGPLGPVVVKQVDRSTDTPAVLTELVPRPRVATRLDTIAGLMAGGSLAVYQVAGENPVSVMSLLGTEPDRAAELVHQVWDDLSAVPAERKVQPIEEICAPIISWSKLAEILSENGIEVPAGSLTASVEIGIRHCDLHPENVLEVSGQAVLIDFDNCAYGAGGIDAITLLLSTLVHPGSPIRGDGWPSVAHIEAAFGTADFCADHPAASWFRVLFDWVSQSCVGPREQWALVLAYAGRQLKYSDVRDEPEKLHRVLAIARRAAEELNRS